MITSTGIAGGDILLSIIICTRNRAIELINCLPALAEQSAVYPDVEVVVVDNGSSDKTREVVAGSITKLGYNFIYVYEPKIGLCNARNRGRQEARGKIIAFIDDDVVLRRDWVLKVRDHFLHGRSDCLAGKVGVIVHGGIPGWFPEKYLYILGETHLGEVAREINYPEHPQGNNFAVKVEVFDKVGGFNPIIPLYGDESEFFRRVAAHKFRAVYCPDIVVDQCIPAHRITRSAIRKKARLLGQGSALLWQLTSPGKWQVGIVILEYLLRIFYVGIKRWVSPGFVGYFTFWRSCGYLFQLLRSVK